MNITNEQYMSVIRSLLKFGGGFAVAKGFASAGDVESVIGIITMVAGMSWSWFVHTPTQVVKQAETIIQKGQN